MFSPGETPWAPLPDPGTTPTVTPVTSQVYVSQDAMVFSDILFSNVGLNILLVADAASGGPDLGYPDFTNLGVIWNEVHAASHSYTLGAGFRIFSNYGSIVALTGGLQARAIDFYFSGLIENFGSIYAISNDGSAIAYNTWSPALIGSASDFVSTNAGIIEAWSGKSFAFGVQLNQGGQLDNSGIIRASGRDEISFEDAIGIRSFGLPFIGTTISNSGSIIANSGPISANDQFGPRSVGIFHNQHGPFTVTNSGLISAKIAIFSTAWELAPFQQPYAVNIHNLASGSIDGDIITGGPYVSALNYAGYSIDTIINDGVIQGNVALGVYDDYFDGKKGLLVGNLSGGDGDDTLIVGRGNQNVDGDTGDDTIVGGSGDDKLNGGAGSDVVNASLGNDTIDGGTDKDTLDGGSGNDRLIGGDGNDSLTGGAGADFLSGDAGLDKASYTKATAAVWVDLATGRGYAGIALNDSLAGIEIVSGSNFNDTLTGSSLNDDLRGRGGSDRMDGGAGNDKLNGGSGNDTLIGGAGNDTLTGGGHNDTFQFQGNFGQDVIADMNAGALIRDVIGIVGFGASYDSFADVLAHTTQVGADTVININGNTITLLGVNVATLDPNDFTFG